MMAAILLHEVSYYSLHTKETKMSTKRMKFIFSLAKFNNLIIN